MNINPKLSFAGIWVPYVASSNANGSVIDFHALVPNLSTGSYGVVVSGWAWTSAGFSTGSQIQTVSIGLFEPLASGEQKLVTDRYVSDPKTNGSGSIIVNDFNSDGFSDILLPAHNESPFKAMASTIYWGKPDGKFDKVLLDDQVMAHDASLNWVNGNPLVVTSTFHPGQNNPTYQFYNDQVEVSETITGGLNGMSSRVFYNKAIEGYQLVRAGVMDGYDPLTQTATSQNINVYSFDAKTLDVNSTNPVQSIVPYLSTLEDYKNFPSSIGGKGLTHTSRVWTDDINYDGFTDILAGESMWTQSRDFPSALQILLNDKRGGFEDATLELNPEMRLNTTEVDYNPTMINLDGSGVNSYLLSGSSSWDNPERQSNYLLLNDGTGRFYAALHDEFVELSPNVYDHVKGTLVASNQSKYWAEDLPTSTVPRFIGVPNAEGEINYLAQISIVEHLDNGGIQSSYAFVNVPLAYNQTTDFVRDVVINDRNESKLIRTWAGSDQITDTNANSEAHIDGGLSLDLSIYSGALAEYKLKSLESEFQVTKEGVLLDKLVNVERLQFSDINVALDTEKGEVAGSAYRIYKAAFDRAPDTDGLGYWIDAMDQGASLTSVAAGFISSPEFQKLFGANVSDRDYVTKLYNNVLDRNPDQGGYEYWFGALSNGASREEILVNFSESNENIANAADLIANGIHYKVWNI